MQKQTHVGMKDQPWLVPPKPVMSQVPWSWFTGAGASVMRSPLAPAPWPGFTFTCGFSGVPSCTLPWWVSSPSLARGTALPQSSDVCSECLQIYFLGTFLLSVGIAWMVLHFQCVSGKASWKARAGGKGRSFSLPTSGPHTPHNPGHASFL